MAVILLLGMATLPLSVNADAVGDIQSGPSSVALSPSAPKAGDTVTILLGLYNAGQTFASDVEYTFYKESQGPNNIIEQGRVDIDSETSVQEDH